MSFFKFRKIVIDFSFYLYYIFFKRRAALLPLSRARAPPPGKKSAERGVRSTTPGLTHNIGDNNVRG